MRQPPPRSIAITGASSGLGLALASHYAEAGIHLALAGRDENRLKSAADACRAKGASVATKSFDIRDRDASKAWIEKTDEQAPIDLLIANAGVSGGTQAGSETELQTRDIFDVNLGGVINVVLPMAKRMETRRRGQIGLMSSLAGHRGLQTAPAYCASKAAVKAWGEGLRGQYAPMGVLISVIMPGFVRTPMTDVNEFPMPFLMSAEDAARAIAKGLARNRGRIAFPLPMAFLTWFVGALSPAIAEPFLGYLPKKR